MTLKNTSNSFTTFENSTTLQKVADLSRTLPFSDWLVSILNFEEHLKQFQWSSSCKLHVNVFSLKIVIVRHNQDRYCKESMNKNYLYWRSLLQKLSRSYQKNYLVKKKTTTTTTKTQRMNLFR